MVKVDDDVVQELAHYVRRLNDECAEGALVVVEGPRDLAALEALGFRGAAFLLSHRAGVQRLVEVMEGYRKAILLLDLDQEGRSLTARVARLLEGRREIDLFYRRELAAITRGRVRQVEELGRFRDLVPPQDLSEQLEADL
jgi:5S rRNA maturation endonuclease (ribonuclease M5)